MTLQATLAKTTITRDPGLNGTLVELQIAGGGDMTGAMTLTELVPLSPTATLQAMKVQALKQAIQRLNQLLQASTPPDGAAP